MGSGQSNLNSVNKRQMVEGGRGPLPGAGDPPVLRDEVLRDVLLASAPIMYPIQAHSTTLPVLPHKPLINPVITPYLANQIYR